MEIRERNVEWYWGFLATCLRDFYGPVIQDKGRFLKVRA